MYHYGSDTCWRFIAHYRLPTIPKVVLAEKFDQKASENSKSIDIVRGGLVIQHRSTTISRSGEDIVVMVGWWWTYIPYYGYKQFYNRFIFDLFSYTLSSLFYRLVASHLMRCHIYTCMYYMYAYISCYCCLSMMPGCKSMGNSMAHNRPSISGGRCSPI